mmetsp:Transcript_8583/g.14278  ORF Transcript_8583/g.14278 Transcript_8583/m.14278 type:complete len:551 (+) Transcript_8583:246-1898(+)|eukprot:CAMPEP_0119009234 /NCGR_PEP_ID=MMETSP1176-20130426/4225_1 /TAXON_ID=265551 /ORGANISM="Synedropsis recta cf, Strain CCMP1620" /LENGTH=550 /DNA_ID=CAMNT_0006961703 /DNA_START=142 /DNA_END=1794 /DNA_ORIENTATION=+
MNNEQTSDKLQSFNKTTATSETVEQKNGNQKVNDARSAPNILPPSLTRESTVAGMMAVHQSTGETHKEGAQSISGSPNTWHVSKNTSTMRRTDDDLHPTNDSQLFPAHRQHHVSLHIRKSAVTLGTTHHYSLPSVSSDSERLAGITTRTSEHQEREDRDFNMSIGEHNKSANENVSTGADSRTNSDAMDDHSESSSSVMEHSTNIHKTGPPRRKRPHKHKPGQTAGRWTPEEHQAFLEGLNIFGREWKKVAERIPTRTSAQIRSHAQKYFSKIQREESIILQDQAAAAAVTMSIQQQHHHQVQASSSFDSVVPEMQVASSYAVQRNVDRILANPNDLEREVEDTLRQLRERYRQLQIRLQQTNTPRGRTNGQPRPTGRLVENEDHHDGQQHQRMRPTHPGADRRKRALQDTSSVSSINRYHQQDDISSVSSTVSGFTPTRELGNEELIALSVLGASLPRSASNQDLVHQAARENISSHPQEEALLRQSRSSSPTSTIASSNREALDGGGMDDSNNSDQSKKRKIDEDSSAASNQDTTNNHNGEDGDGMVL